jgi:hypothetical protein
MSAPEGVTETAASLLEADPTLARVLGARTAARLGHDPILPVLYVPPGPWVPPERRLLGSGTVALVVLDGLLVGGFASTLAGPHDVLEPWDREGTWTACTAVRLAVIGSHFMEALREWPQAAARLLARAHGRGPDAAAAGSLDERLLAQLWRVGGRWGVPDGDALALPAALDVRAAGALLGLSESDVAPAVTRLSATGAVARREGQGWLLRTVERSAAVSGRSQGRRDSLRARAAQQIALSRVMRDECTALTEELGAQLARRHRRSR